MHIWTMQTKRPSKIMSPAVKKAAVKRASASLEKAKAVKFAPKKPDSKRKHSKNLYLDFSVSKSVKESLSKEVRKPGIEYVVVVRKGPNSQTTLKTVGRLVGGKNSSRVRIDPITDEGATDISIDAFVPDAKAKALLRGVAQAKADLVRAGGAYSLDEVRLLLGDISRQAVYNKVKEGALFSIQAPGGRVCFPTLQFTKDGPVGGMRELVNVFPSENRWMLLNFLIHPDDRLGEKRPIDVLKAGDIEAVVEAAKAMGQQGA